MPNRGPPRQRGKNGRFLDRPRCPPQDVGSTTTTDHKILWSVDSGGQPGIRSHVIARHNPPTKENDNDRRSDKRRRNPPMSGATILPGCRPPGDADRSGLPEPLWLVGVLLWGRPPCGWPPIGQSSSRRPTRTPQACIPIAHSVCFPTGGPSVGPPHNPNGERQ